MSYFFSEPARHTLSITRKAHLQRNGRDIDSMKVTPLNAEGKEFRLIAQLVEFPPGGANAAINAFQETGAVVYVLEGRLRLDAGGMHDVLEPGDCACMESEMPMAWSAADKHRCRVLAVLPREALAKG
jgi:quercetin dioxygenase-like cupin family protein